MRDVHFIANEISNVTFSVMLPMLRDSASFFTIPDTQEGFPTSGNDRNNNKFVILACPESLFIGEGYFRDNDNTKELCQLT